MKRTMRGLHLTFILIAVSGAYSIVVVAARADTKLWTTDVSGLFNVASNWTGGVPGASDIAYFRFFGSGSPLPYTVTFPGLSIFQPPVNYMSGSLRVGPNTVNFAQSSGLFAGASTYTLNSAIEIGETSGIPSILSTTLFFLASPKATVGFFGGSQGTLNVNSGLFSVTGSSSSYDLIVGDNGAGVMNVFGGAQVSVTGAASSAVLGNSAGVTGTVNISDPESSWNNNSNDSASLLAVGGFGTGILNINAGGHVTDFASDIAYENGSIGSATVSGAGSTWTNRGTLIVGVRGLGSLAISSGGVVSDNSSVIGSAPGATGAVTVTGTGSKWNQTLDLRLGNNPILNGGIATGVLHVSAGGQVSTGRDADVGAAGNGTVTVDGIGSKWTVGGTLTVNDAGSLNITGGALVTSGPAFDDSAINVIGAGSTLNTSDYLYVGVSVGSAGPVQTLHVASGAHVNNRLGFLGAFQGSIGQVTIDGAGSTWATAEQLFIGLEGEGQFFVLGGGHATSDTGQLGVSFNGTGWVSVAGAGSTWANTGDVYVGVAGNGKLTASDGGLVTVGGLLSVGPRGTVEGNSHVAGTVRNGGTVAPGLSTSVVQSDAIGTLNLDGDYTQTAAGALDIQLASITSFDKLVITGHATLGGTLQGSLFNNFAAAVGDMFQILTATDGITGKFSSLDFSSLSTAHGPKWIIVYSSSDVILKLVNLPSGDYNQDGIVDSADYVMLRKGLDTTYTQNDYDVWRAHFGQTAGSGAGAIANAAVPEPATLLQIILVAGVVSTRRRRGN